MFTSVLFLLTQSVISEATSKIPDTPSSSMMQSQWISKGKVSSIILQPLAIDLQLNSVYDKVSLQTQQLLFTHEWQPLPAQQLKDKHLWDIC